MIRIFSRIFCAFIVIFGSVHAAQKVTSSKKVPNGRIHAKKPGMKVSTTSIPASPVRSKNGILAQDKKCVALIAPLREEIVILQNRIEELEEEIQQLKKDAAIKNHKPATQQEKFIADTWS